ncbi:hypothetical protein SMICM17S_02086 [Streptomyces microflavus]
MRADPGGGPVDGGDHRLLAVQYGGDEPLRAEPDGPGDVPGEPLARSGAPRRSAPAQSRQAGGGEHDGPYGGVGGRVGQQGDDTFALFPGDGVHGLGPVGHAGDAGGGGAVEDGGLDGGGGGGFRFAVHRRKALGLAVHRRTALQLSRFTAVPPSVSRLTGTPPARPVPPRPVRRRHHQRVDVQLGQVVAELQGHPLDTRSTTSTRASTSTGAPPRMRPGAGPGRGARRACAGRPSRRRAAPVPPCRAAPPPGPRRARP